MKEQNISIIIPVYNEEERIEPGLSDSIKCLISKLSWSFEIIFVNDGSTDKTLSILNNVKTRFNELAIKIISYQKNQGKGFAVKTGVLEASGRKIIVTDADFSVSLEELPKFIDNLDRFDIVIGTKKHLLTDTVKHQKAPRRILGKGFTLLSNFILGLNYTDITCGFKGFKSDAAKFIFSKQLMKRWSYDAETLFLAGKFNYRVCELPVKWRHIDGSKVSPFWDTLRSLKDLLAIVWNNHQGKYRD